MPKTRNPKEYIKAHERGVESIKIQPMMIFIIVHAN